MKIEINNQKWKSKLKIKIKIENLNWILNIKI